MKEDMATSVGVGTFVDQIPLPSVDHSKQGPGVENDSKTAEDLLVDSCCADSWSGSSLEQCSSSPHSVAPSMSSAREALDKALFFSPRRSVSLRRRSDSISKRKEKEAEESLKSPDLASIIVARKLSIRRRRRGSKNPCPFPPRLEDGFVSPTTVTQIELGENTILDDIDSAKEQPPYVDLSFSLDTTVDESTSACSSSAANAASAQNKRRVRFGPRVSLRNIVPLDELIDDPRSILWYQEEEFEAIRAKIYKIVYKVRAEGLEREPGQKKVMCIRGLERFIEQERTQEFRLQALESVLSLREYDFGATDPEEMADQYKAATQESMAEAIDRARVDASDAIAYYKKRS
jgi:hypothetical protein